jgi:hypothetical protein
VVEALRIAAQAEVTGAAAAASCWICSLIAARLLLAVAIAA